FGLVQGDANAVAPYKRPLSSMTPTILIEEVSKQVAGAGKLAALGDSGRQSSTRRREDNPHSSSELPGSSGERLLPSAAVRLVLGSPGGGTIINTVLQVLLNVLVFKMDVQQAVDAPRFHHQWMPDKLWLENRGFSADTVGMLREAGYKI